MANEGYHESIQELSEETKDMHRAITSLMEELEVVDWYNQRVDPCQGDVEFRTILAHNRDEEKEHASMILGEPSPVYNRTISPTDLAGFTDSLTATANQPDPANPGQCLPAIDNVATSTIDAIDPTN